MTTLVEEPEGGGKAAPAREATPPAEGPASFAPRGESRWLFKAVLEVVLISLGVFLAMMADQWRDRAHDRELAMTSLQRFRAEIQANRDAVISVRDYHVTLQTAIADYLGADPKTRTTDKIQIRGLRPVFFEHTAWDLALATQSLTHIDEDIAFRLSRAYGLQQTYGEMTRGIMQAVYLRPLMDNLEGLSAYYGDLVLWEPQLIQMYDELLTLIDRALAAGR